ncbi:cyclic peptide transporter [Caballeronia arationis]|jgi:putative ATP-binding cassette transporter|uniref:Putative ATP-binding cassette transporter n=2 Tax=Caballeronia arationis TaxID=1777142 RepID=A0A7Z7N182_9BURK|nr:cyclic peptide export ABC transporter [Caballeronia arationis]SAL06774.1 cyclic peptide transporter [Caballeronia arationis]SOE57233.1 putative ATP-binding cassette transporter [Caballeronia arationis]
MFSMIPSEIRRQSLQRIVIGVIAGFVGALCSAEIARLISSVAGGQIPTRGLAIGFFAVCVAQLLFRTSSQILIMDFGQQVICSLRIELCRKILHTPYKKLEALGKPRLLAILTTDVGTFAQAAQMLPVTFGHLVLVAVCLGYMAWLSWQAFACFFVFLVTAAVIYHCVERWPLREMQAVRDQLDIIFRHFRSLLEGTRELQLNTSRAQYFTDHVVHPTAHRFRRSFTRAMLIYSLVANAGGMLFYVAIGLILLVMPHWFPQAPGVLVTLTLLLLFLIQPVSEVMNTLPILRQASIALARIRILDAELAQAPDDDTRTTQDDPFATAVEGAPLLRFAGVSHRYPGLTEDRPFTLGPIDLSIKQGEVIYLIGGNGSGKTTLAMLLLGLYEPEQGHVELNGVKIERHNLVQYRQRFSAVFADFHLFDEILCQDQAQIASRATHYLHTLELDHKVSLRGNRFSTTSLSSGQRKRMALIASYLEDRPIYLFDEWAADQDPVFRRVFYTELIPDLKRKGKTVIVISHDDAYFECADRLVQVAQGRLVDVSAEALKAGLYTRRNGSAVSD